MSPAHARAVAAPSPRAAWDPPGPGPRRHLDTCREALGSDRAVAEILGVSPSQVSRWRTGQLPDLDNADRLSGLALVVEMLARWLAPEVREGWLQGPNAHLADRSPAYLIRLGRVADVIGAVEAEKAGVHA
jgi:transcriptional regulator with XRE-family HTH domain